MSLCERAGCGHSQGAHRGEFVYRVGHPCVARDPNSSGCKCIAFVGPTPSIIEPAPQPPADATTREVVICEHGLLLKDIDGNVHAPSCGCQDDKPAGLSTAASAGEAIVQEIADKLCDDVENYVAMEQATRDAGEGLECERVTDECHAKIHGALHTAYAAGIARGRELGARDSIEDVGKVIADNGCDCEGDDCPTSEATCEELGHEPCLAHRVERAIAARRAGRTT